MSHSWRLIPRGGATSEREDLWLQAWHTKLRRSVTHGYVFTCLGCRERMGTPDCWPSVYLIGTPIGEGEPVIEGFCGDCADDVDIEQVVTARYPGAIQPAGGRC